VADYDKFADRYDQTFQLAPVRTQVEAYSILRLLGDVTGQAWLDLACGTGAYSRALRRRGAHPVLGIDLSPEMIGVAQTAEEEAPLDVKYLVQDVGAMDDLGQFDGALGAYLLHYGTSVDHLHRMCQGISRNLRPGGRFVTYQLNPDFSRQPGYYLRYGTDLHFDPDIAFADGYPFSFRVKVSGFESPELAIYYWSRQALDDALHTAGFGLIRWITPELSPEATPESEWWQDYLKQPMCMLIEGVKDR
jgi:toxoflavin synthase